MAEVVIERYGRVLEAGNSKFHFHTSLYVDAISDAKIHFHSAGKCWKYLAGGNGAKATTNRSFSQLDRRGKTDRIRAPNEQPALPLVGPNALGCKIDFCRLFQKYAALLLPARTLHISDVSRFCPNFHHAVVRTVQ
jgi:hypothetical protein